MQPPTLLKCGTFYPLYKAHVVRLVRTIHKISMYHGPALVHRRFRGFEKVNGKQVLVGLFRFFLALSVLFFFHLLHVNGIKINRC